MKPSINDILVGRVSLESEPDLIPAMESLIDMATLVDSRITLEGFINQFELSDGNMVDVMVVDGAYKQWLADEGVVTAVTPRSSPEESLADARRTLAALHNPSLESDLVQMLKRTYDAVSTNLRTFGKNLFKIKMELKAKQDSIAANPILLDTPDIYRFLSKDDKPVAKFVSCIDDDVKFIEACEKHYKTLFEKSTEMSKVFRAAATSMTAETIREAIDFFDTSLLDRNGFEDLTKFRLLGNRVVELDKKGYPKITKLAGDPIKFTTKADDEHNLTAGITNGTINGFSIGGAPKAVLAVPGMDAVAGQKAVTTALSKTGGAVPFPDFMKVMDRAQVLNQDSVRFAQMAASMGERVARLSDDLDDAYDNVINKETGKFDHVVYRELMDLHKSARRSVSQYMFLGKLIATMMEDHATYVYRGVTTMANKVLSKAK